MNIDAHTEGRNEMPNPFAPLRDALQQLDQDLRKKGTCRKCRKPTSGFIPAGMTREQAGICDCEERVKREKRNAAARARRQVYADLGLKRVRGNLGGIYYE
jgi:hypothetical protein